MVRRFIQSTIPFPQLVTRIEKIGEIMEHLSFAKKAETPNTSFPKSSTLKGVVSSGNLEVLIEVVDLDKGCQFEIDTAAEGFATTWEAVIDNFMTRRAPGNLRVTINDYAASPDVVGLRLDQAYESLN